MPSLQRQAISGVKWTVLQTGLVAGTGPVLQIIKARFLVPEEFAYIAIIMIFIGLFKTLENFGISQAIIQRDSIDEKEASSLFFFNIFLSIIFGAVLFFLSIFIAKFFTLPDLEYYLKITSLIVVVGGPANLFRALLEKNLLFKELSIIEMTRNVLVFVFVIMFLLMGFGVLGVIYGNVISTFIGALATTFLCIKKKLISVVPYFSIYKIVPFLRFGIYVSGKQAMTFCAHRMDEVIIGYFLAPEVLGIYHFGKHMLEKLRELITASFAKVLFPLFTKLKHDNEKISLAYRKISGYISFVSFPIFSGIAVTAHLFVPVLFGEEWVESVIVFQVISLALLLMVITANISSSLLYSVNKPELVFYIDVVTNSIYFITLYLFVSEGLIAILSVYSLYVIYKTLTLQVFANKQLTYSFYDYFSQLKPAVALSLAMVFAVMLFQSTAQEHLYGLSLLIGSIVIGVFVYLILGLLFHRHTLKELKSALLKGTTVKT